MKKSPLFLFVLLLAVFTACSKSSSPAPVPEPTKEELLVKASWKISEVQANGTKDNTTDYSSYRITFASNKTYTLTYAGNTTTGVWELTTDGKTLTLDKGTSKQIVMEVQTLTATNLDVKYTNKDYKTGSQAILQKMIPA